MSSLDRHQIPPGDIFFSELGMQASFLGLPQIWRVLCNSKKWGSGFYFVFSNNVDVFA